MSYSQVVDLLNDLLEVHYHAENTYKKGIEHVDDETLKSFFVVKAAEKASMVNELTDIIIRLNGTPLKVGLPSQTASKIWSDVLLFFKGNSKVAIIEECKKAEKIVLNQYEEVLKHSSITDFNREILVGQHREIEEGIASSFTM
ncbi:PA2169 family four-helix-bundle protein [Ulvibacterium marinum]|uniref:PA2169 family four-helix-bundle protein n=1 Tax=Ulvibacterium marinum TaxID=2419782 RepID=A0A3B0C1V7_9FLAO|nr:PA2169 family four-helix-bundle protein [Ulvibacterium marinum]RKN78738.1 PA2169 family four-helix-bundle protein [Ulvibacterium marinum]